jgi:uncharacterized membrane protein YccC
VRVTAPELVRCLHKIGGGIGLRSWLERESRMCRPPTETMKPSAEAVSGEINWKWHQVLVHSTRTAVTAVTSLLVARLFRLPEWYWAPITTLVIEQSSLGAALVVSWHRFVGTMLGSAVGALVAYVSGGYALAFGVSVFLLGVLRTLTKSDLNGYRFGAVTVAIVLLVPRTGPAWLIALHRFAEVSIGIAVALIMALLWPEKEASASGHAVIMDHSVEALENSIS